MKPIREIVVREYLPGDYEVECEGRVKMCHSRRERDAAVDGFCSADSYTHGPVAGYNGGVERPWGEDVDYLKERADA